MGVAITKPHLLLHTFLITLTQFFVNHAKSQSGLSFNLFLIAKQLPVGVAITKPHPYVVKNLVPGDHTSIFDQIGPSIDFL